jgi:N-acetylglucosamine-6-phosphate deacetylase
VTVSAGHTDASAAEANAAFDRGVRTVTHLFNAMRPFTHRDPGVAGAALARPDVTVQLIHDGVHLDPDTVRMVWQAAGRPARARHRRGRRRRAAATARTASATSRSRCATASSARRRRRPRRQRPDHDRRGAEPARARRPARGGARRGDRRAGARDRRRRRPDRDRRPRDLIVLSEELEIERVLVGGEARVAA